MNCVLIVVIILTCHFDMSREELSTMKRVDGQKRPSFRSSKTRAYDGLEDDIMRGSASMGLKAFGSNRSTRRAEAVKDPGRRTVGVFKNRWTKLRAFSAITGQVAARARKDREKQEKTEEKKKKQFLKAHNEFMPGNIVVLSDAEEDLRDFYSNSNISNQSNASHHSNTNSPFQRNRYESLVPGNEIYSGDEKAVNGDGNIILGDGPLSPVSTRKKTPPNLVAQKIVRSAQEKEESKLQHSKPQSPLTPAQRERRLQMIGTLTGKNVLKLICLT